jgi:mono/diheme cytochrome c family protein/ketosteroid isomerase-like protein
MTVQLGGRSRGVLRIKAQLMKVVKFVAIAVISLAVVGIGLIFSGAYNVAADAPHWRATQWLLDAARERSIAVRSSGSTVPPLDDAKLIAMGADHYAEMCTSCHLAPDLQGSELRTGLYPQPPNLVEHGRDHSPEQTFWIIKHGFKMTGMPAWGATHDDHGIWAMVAFLRKLPELSPQAYRALIAQGADGDTHSEHSGHHDTMEMAPMTGEMDSDPAPPPAAVVDQFFRALASGDTNTASALLDPAVLIYESGGVERSRSEYAAEHLGADAAFLKSDTHKMISRTGGAVGDLAWVATEARLTSQGAKPADLVSTETMILRKQPGGWRIIHIHWSSRKTAH